MITKNIEILFNFCLLKLFFILIAYLKDPTRTKAKKSRKLMSKKKVAGVTRRKEKHAAKEQIKFKIENKMDSLRQKVILIKCFRTCLIHLY